LQKVSANHLKQICGYMPVKLRLKRQGRRNWPHYAIVASDSRSPRDGRFIEKIGFYDAVANPGRVYIDHAAAIKWLAVGAQPTTTVRNLLRHAGVTVKFALIRQGKTEEQQELIFNKWWEEKKAKTKKSVVVVDVSGNPLEYVPKAENPGYTAPPKKEAPAPVAEVVEEVAETAPEVEAAPEVVAEEAPSAEAEA
jgi:small subunit ribosomal protein S16